MLTLTQRDEHLSRKKNAAMKQTISITVEHIIVASNRSYEQVIDALEARLGPARNWEALRQHLRTTNASRERIVQALEESLGTGDFALFSRTDHGPLLSLQGKTSRATQYTIGNPFLAVQMTRYQPEAGLYAPLRLVVYEDEAGKTFVAYDSFISLLMQYQREEITRVAQLVEHKLEALVAEVTTGEDQRS